MPRLQFSLRALLIFVTTCASAMGVLMYYRSAAVRVPALIKELDNRPGGFIDLGWSGRDTREIHEDIRAYGGHATDYLIQALDRGDLHHPELVLLELGETRDSRAYEILVSKLASSSRLERAAAAFALGEFGDRSAVGPLIDRIADHDFDTRVATIAALGTLGDRKAVAPLLEVLDGNTSEIRGYVVEALGRIGDSSVVKRLCDALVSDRDSWVRKESAVALGRIGDRSALPALGRARFDAYPPVRDAAAAAEKQLAAK